MLKVLRFRSRTGRCEMSNVDVDVITLGDVRRFVQSALNIPINRQKLLVGFPKSVEIVGSSTSLLKDLGCDFSSLINVQEYKDDELLSPNALQNNDSWHINKTSFTFYRHVVDSDNSCLFNSVNYLLKLCPSAMELRKVIVNEVTQQPDKWTEGMLGRPVPDYCSWISKSDSWGGAIELAVLSSFYCVEIAAVDVIHVQMFRFGEDMGYPRRIFLLYDGIHYDAVVAKLATEEVTVFESSDVSTIESVMALARDANAKRQYTDTSKFTLRCAVCKVGVVGESGAIKHASETGHQNFVEADQ